MIRRREISVKTQNVLMHAMTVRGAHTFPNKGIIKLLVLRGHKDKYFPIENL